MIQVEYLNNGALIKHFSDANVMLLQSETGLLYSDPIDAVPCRYTYSETDIQIEDEAVESENDEMHEE